MLENIGRKKTPNVPEYSVVHKESGDSENFCPIKRHKVNSSLDIETLSFLNKTMPFEVSWMLLI